MKYFFILLIGLGFAAGCSEDEPELAIDPALEGILETFAQEAASRGVLIDYESLNLTARLQTVTRAGVAGFCSSTQEGDPEIVVDRDFWNRVIPLQQELVVFHELGHCILGRGHTDDLDDMGNCLSIMNTFVNTCQSSFNSMTRSQYLDELFNQ
jgi:hypothetical protein